MTHYINGKWLESQGQNFSSINPFTQKQIWSGTEATAKEVDLAITAAQTAFETWGKLAVSERLTYLEKFIQLLADHKDRLAQLLCDDSGKTLWECKMEISAMIGKLAISVESFNERCGDRSKAMGSSHLTTMTNTSTTRFKPHGIVAIYGPYNFPGHVPNGHIIPALLAGNTVVFKPSELTPLISEEIIKLWELTKIPNGVINLVQGKAETGILLAQDPRLKGIFFTGSSRTGKILHENYAKQPDKILALEMGGNNPLIAHEFKDLDAAVYLIIQSAFMSSGQRCTCARRLILIESEQTQTLIKRLVELSARIKVGNPNNDDTFMGPVISAIQGQKILDKYQELIEAGAKPLLEMRVLENNPALLSPAIIDCSEISTDEEVFGPLLQVKIVKDWDSAIIEANNTRYGLSAGLISDSKELYEDFYQRIEAGLINWNNQLTGASSSAPFGGIKDSGNHRPTAYHAADYCSYPVSSLESANLELPEKLSPGLDFSTTL